MDYNYKVVVHSDDWTLNAGSSESLSSSGASAGASSIQNYDVLIVANPKVDFTTEEIECMKAFLQEGKSIAFFGSGGSGGGSSGGGGKVDDRNSNTMHRHQLVNLEKFLMEYGIQFENDTVVRTSFFKYLHPKHVFIDDGVLHPTLQPSVNENSSLSLDENDSSRELGFGSMDMDDSFLEDEEEKLKIVFPYGSTLNANLPSLPILSSGAVSFPANRPIAAIWDAFNNQKGIVGSRIKENNRGKMLFLGSSDMFADEWLEKEGNTNLVDKLIKFLAHDDSVVFDRLHSTKDNRIDEPKTVPDIEALSERLRSCLEQNEPLPQDLGSLLHDDMLTYDTNLIPEVIELYKALNVKKEPLTLIPPDFERPIPPLKPAVFHPKMKELPIPPLEQFDLDEEFAESSARLAHLTNTCAIEDLDYYIEEAGSIIGLVDENEAETDAKVVLHALFKKVS